MSNDKERKDKKGDENMVMIKAQTTEKQKISRQELRKKLIRETIKENRVALEKLSRT